MDGTVKITGDVCCSCKSRQYRKKYKEEKEELRVVSNTDTLSVIDMISKLNSLGYVIIKREEYEKMSTMVGNLKTQEDNE